MIASFSSVNNEQTSPSMNDWLEQLNKGKKSTAQLQQNIISGTVDTVDQIKNIETTTKINETEETDEDEDSTNTTGKTVQDYQEPSTVTKEQLKSPIDLKL